ncbi:hypothetical protein [Vibrio parahaemolyticus]|uniref:Uncharacterized protein n=1 Tax=Vibrio parahaemolyticus TaxID=670 RepID=A0AA46UR90_VIBPH|nr:hypothetical protein [Vibrio parahaemolyticus]UYV30093.1 hypothetical protein M5598_23685 [Vibrio parahaemolyticus]
MRAVRFRMKRGKSTFNLDIPKGIKGNDIYIPDLVSVGGDYFGDLDFVKIETSENDDQSIMINFKDGRKAKLRGCVENVRGNIELQPLEVNQVVSLKFERDYEAIPFVVTVIE